MRNMLAVLILASCVSQTGQQVVESYRAARDRGDDAAAQRWLAPDARIWFEKKEGPGEPYGRPGSRYEHWDRYFHSRSTMTDWQSHDGALSALVHETNDFYRLLDWQPAPYRLTFRFDDAGRIREVLLTSTGAKSTSRLEEFESWARAHHPEELAYLLPNGRVDPTGDRPERWTRILTEWRSVRQ
ncbi:MAG TPA: hypothetical protein VJ276_06330 [Thermoanaerobaculia bacterium]|nr:hypothetical protein [Thermoanaerobaculia bacterium]